MSVGQRPDRRQRNATGLAHRIDNVSNAIDARRQPSARVWRKSPRLTASVTLAEEVTPCQAGRSERDSMHRQLRCNKQLMDSSRPKPLFGESMPSWLAVVVDEHDGVLIEFVVQRKEGTIWATMSKM
ncbi:hypothetical protein AK812_SmicGene24570 [Symbiodinium microadriaticum]|uniref:Uncharacterized protein n=1 Tax=Symbiodinium microadriaticum TaxID=2951 RepID=A0A1Q9DED0_SYMMI|nr:hypothetical protein AK812_SmicGene24570 [Symbiodinium microadriaticum]